MYLILQLWLYVRYDPSCHLMIKLLLHLNIGVLGYTNLEWLKFLHLMRWQIAHSVLPFASRRLGWMLLRIVLLFLQCCANHYVFWTFSHVELSRHHYLPVVLWLIWRRWIYLAVHLCLLHLHLIELALTMESALDSFLGVTTSHFARGMCVLTKSRRFEAFARCNKVVAITSPEDQRMKLDLKDWVTIVASLFRFALAISFLCHSWLIIRLGVLFCLLAILVRIHVKRSRIRIWTKDRHVSQAASLGKRASSKCRSTVCPQTNKILVFLDACFRTFVA
jgi:hypothetical protein